MSSELSPDAVLQQLAEHPKAAELALLVRTAALTAADERRNHLQDGLQELMAEAGLGFDDGETELGNALRGLEQPSRATRACRRVLAALLARGVALQPPSGRNEERRLAEQLAWLAAHTVIDGLWALDEALGPGAEGVWRGLGEIIRGLDSGERSIEDRPSGLAAAAALAASASSGAGATREALIEDIGDPTYRRLLALSRGPQPAAAASWPDPSTDDSAPQQGPSGPAEAAADRSAIPLTGELVPVPMRTIWLVLWAATGLLLLRVLLRWIGRLVLRMRRPAELRVDPQGVHVFSRLEVVGRTIRTSESLIVRENLARAERLVRYPRLALYAGLVALGVGSYLGVSLFVDGARAGSPSLLALGAGVFGVGLLLDLVLTVLVPGRRGKVRVVIVPRKGGAFALQTKDGDAASAAIRRLAG